VAILVGLGAGCTSWWQPYPACGNHCARPTIDIDQENVGYGHYRDNFADASINYTSASYFSYRGGVIDIDQANVGNGHDRNNIGYATIDHGGNHAYYGWYYGGNQGKINIDQENYGNGNERDNAAFATWTW